MTQSPVPPSLAPPQPSALYGSGVQVRCAGCRDVLVVASGHTEFFCPSCQLPQMLPPELIVRAYSKSLPLPTPPPPPPPPSLAPPPPPPPPSIHHVPAHGIDPTKMQLPCANCKALLNVPHGLTRFVCPQCAVDLAVDVSKLHQFFPSRLPPPEEVNEVAIEVEREEDEGGIVGETFTEYHPPKLSIGPPHPDPVVETSSLSAVQPPEPTYDLKIKDDLEKSKTLSCLQIETLVYASQRHMHHLPNDTRAGFFIGDGAGVGKGRTIAGLLWENWYHGRRKALWISVGSDLKYDARRDLDDVGAACIEVHALNKLPYSKLDSKSVGIREGVVFLTYSSLIASSERGRSRLQQLVQWCGTGFDGLIVFDECHKAKNLVPEAGSQPTRTGEAVLELQDRLPEARIIYCSATGASEPRNMGYMVRLGLWGTGTSFIDFRDFLGALERGGVGALELVAMDMKARGMYLCRTLSYRGAEFEIVEAPLEAEMMEMYKLAAEFWAKLRVELMTACAYVTSDKPSTNQLWRLFWASHQRFFRHLCMSAKVPATVRLAKQALLEDKCVVIGLQSTGEARTEEAVTKYGLELDDFVSGPRELLLKFVEENYPLPEKPETLPEEGSVKELQRKRHSATPGISLNGRLRKAAKWKPPSDVESDEESETDSAPESTESDDEFQICEICNTEEGRKKLLQCSCCEHLFHPACLDPPLLETETAEWSCQSCKEKTDEYLKERKAVIAELLKRYDAASDRKSSLLAIIRSLNLPNNPLDDIIDQLGGPDKVAEITGRRGMLVRASNGKGVTYQPRNSKDVTMEMVNMHEKQLFMDGKKFVAIISEAGSAGVSLQADRRAANQKRRVHFTLELPWSADRAIQQFGRTHRSNQASAPEYRLLFTNLGGERRFASIVAKRLESLGALTQGDRRAGLSLSAYNYDSAYGKMALTVMYRGIMEQDVLPVEPPGCSSGKPDSIRDFIENAKAALNSVGIIRDAVLATGKDSGKTSGRIVESDMNDIGRFLNRLLGLPPEIQNRIFELFVSILDLLVQKARIEGNLDSGIVDMRANVIELRGSPKTVHVDPVSGASTMLFTFTLDRGVTWESASTILDEKQKDGLGSTNDGFYESKRDWLGRRHFILAFESSIPGMYKIVRPAIGESLREMSLSELRSKYRKTPSLEKARSGWEDEYDISSKQCMHGPNCKLGNFCTVGRRIQEVNVLGGLILPVWGTIEKALSKQARQSHKRLHVVRIETTTDNQRIVAEPSKVIHVRNVGHEISENDLLQLFQPFGVITKLVMLRAKNQALIQMQDVPSAVNALQFFANVQPSIRGRNVYVQFSSHQELTTADQNAQGRGDEPNRILLVTIHHMLYPITVEVLHQVFFPHGFVEKIVTFQKSAGFQALIQYQTRQCAISARTALQGRNIYDGCCQLDIQFSNLDELQVNYNNERSRDFTNPSLPSEPKGRSSQQPGYGDAGGMYALQASGAGPVGFPQMANAAAVAAAFGGGLPPGVSGTNDRCTVLVSNLNPDRIDEDKLFNLFSIYGNIARIKLLRNKPDHALVQMGDGFQAELAVHFLKGAMLFGKRLEVNFSKHPNITQGADTHEYANSNLNRFNRNAAKNYRYCCSPTKMIHISSLSQEVTEEEIVNLLEEHGPIINTKLFEMNGKKQALIMFDTEEQATEALVCKHASSLSGSIIRISFSQLQSI